MNVRFYATLLASLFVAMSAQAAQIPDGKSGFATDSDCINAAVAGTASSYVPAVSGREPGAGYKKTTMASKGYTAGACVQGLTVFTPETWVYLPPEFVVGERAEHLVMWACGNAIRRISAVPVKQEVRVADPRIQLAAPLCDAKCQIVKFCGENGYAVSDKMTPEGKWACVPPQVEVEIQQGVLVTGVVTQKFGGWSARGDRNIPPAPIAVNMAKPSINVYGQRCEAYCQARAFGFVTKSIPTLNGTCGIVTSGRVFKLGHHKTTGEVGMVEIDGNLREIGNILNLGTKVKDCNKVQTWLEGRGDHWKDTIKFFGLPNNCVADRRQGEIRPYDL